MCPAHEVSTNQNEPARVKNVTTEFSCLLIAVLFTLTVIVQILSTGHHKDPTSHLCIFTQSIPLCFKKRKEKSLKIKSENDFVSPFFALTPTVYPLMNIQV